jgi:predicted MFS family arabinose efflux permease
LGAFAVGSFCGSLAFGRHAVGVGSDRWLASFAAVQGATLAPVVAAAPWPWLLLLVAPLAGLAIGPTYTLLSAAAGVAAPLGSEIEAQAWINSGYGTGEALGTALAGGLAPTAGLLLASSFALLAGVLAWRGGRRVPATAEPGG